MFALKPRIEIVIRLSLIVAVLLNALAPTAAFAEALVVQSQSPTAKLLQAVTETPTPEPTASPTDTPTPELSSTPVPTAEDTITPTDMVTLTPTLDATSTPLETETQNQTPTPSGTPTVVSTEPALSFKISVNPEQAAPGEEVTFTIEITNNGNTSVNGLLFSNTLPEYFGNGQSGLKDFDFNPQTRKLIWKGTKANGEDTEIPAGQTLVLDYTVKIEPKPTEVQIVDTASLTAEDLSTPLLAETTLTILDSDQKLTMIDAKGGKAKGLDGLVNVDIPENSLHTFSAIIIKDLRQKGDLQSKLNSEPAIKFSLEMRVPQPSDAQFLPGPVDVIPSIELSTTPMPEGSTPNLNEEQHVQENDRLIPLKAVEAKFEKPVELIVSFNGLTDLNELGADQIPFIITLDDISGTWVRVPLSTIDRKANTVTAETTHFSTWGAGIGPSTPTNGANILLFDSADPDLFTGRSKYSIPIWTPTGRNGMAPSLALSYSSGKIDGILGDVQSSWGGMGWNIDTVEIARKITTCNCSFPTYGYQNSFVLLFNGTGYELIPDGTTPGRYHTKSESFLYIQRHNDSLGNNSPIAQNATGEWWEIIERDGTHWRLGWNTGSEQLAAMKGYPGAATGSWASLGYAGHAINVVAFRWRADQVTDTFGNRMSFAYFEQTRPVAFTSTDYDRASYLDTISYTEHTSGNPAPGYSIVFVRENRNTNDIPWIIFDADNWDDYQLDRIEVKYGLTVVRTYNLAYESRSYNDEENLHDTRVLSSLTISGGGINTPPMTFSYTDKDNRANCGAGCREWAYPRLATISNGWGGVVIYTYGNDGRPSNSWYNWRVEAFDIYDGVNASPMKTTFVYSGPCYNDASAGWCNTSYVGELIGYNQTTETNKDFNGSTNLSSVIHKFEIAPTMFGTEYETQRQDSSGTILSQTNTSVNVTTLGLPPGGYFKSPASVEEFLRIEGNLNRVSRTEYTYDASTGNLTNEKQYDGTPTLYRQIDYEYVINTSSSVWILNTLSRQTLKDSLGTILSKKEFGYDGNLPGVGSPIIGKLTLSRVVDGIQTIDNEYHYDIYGNLTSTILYKSYGVSGSQPVSGPVKTYTTEYDTTLQTYVTSTTNPLSQTTTTSYDYGLGLPIFTTDPNGNTTTTYYDGLGRVTSVTYPGYGQPNVIYSYLPPPVSAPYVHALKMEFWDQTANTYRSTWQLSDGLGRVLQTQDPYETAGYLVLTDTSYNAQGIALYNGLSRTLSGTGGNFFAPSWGSIPHTTTSYDALERPILISYPDGSQETFNYSGLRTTTLDRNNHQKVQEEDSFGRLLKVEEYTGNNPYTLYATTTYEYDVRDLLKKVTDAVGNQTNIGYNGFGRKTSMSDPDMGTWGYGYDVLGNLTSQTDARFCVTTITYDDLNRPTQKTYSGPGNCATTPSVTYTYDSIAGGNEGIGRRTSMTDGSGSTTWFYNVLGQVTNETHNVDSTNYIIATTFDAFSRTLTQTLPSGEALNYSYNAMGALSGLSGTTSTYVSQIHYAASGQITDQLLGNNLRQQSCYDANTLRPTKVRVYPGTLQTCGSSPASPNLNLTYSYQPNGNVSQMVDSTRSETLSYTYDELDRLLNVSGSYSQTYSYNSIGNLISKGTSSTTSVIALNSITTGFNHSCALTNGGGVVCWGNNDYGQLGDGTTTTRLTPVMVSGLSSGVVAVKAGGFYTCALTQGGGMKCWGLNGNGVLGDGTATNRSTPVDVSGLTTGVVAISAGYDHTCALTTAGGVKCWGNNANGAVGDGTFTNPKYSPVFVSGLTSGVAAISAGARHTCALTTGGALKCWGYNAQGQLGDNTIASKSSPVTVNGLTSGVSSVSAGEQHTCARLTGGGVKCWGANGNGQLGDGSNTQHLTPFDVSGLTTGILSISVGNFHSCAKKTTGEMLCWGNNAQGQLGDGTTTSRSIPTAVSGLSSGVSLMAPGLSHTCVLVSSGWVKCWGENNTFGRLGDGTTVQRNTAISISGLTNGGSPIEAGGFHTCSLTSNRGAKCWGYNNSGQLGDNTQINRSTPVDVNGLTSGVEAVSAGYLHTCALTTAGGVKCWGNNGQGQLGDGTTTQRLIPVNVSGLTSGVVAITSGTRHTCALTTAGGVKCWGENIYGQLGNGNTNPSSSPVDVSGLTGVAAISAGEQHSCALTSSGGVKCWGTNGYGQLGDGTNAQRLTPVSVSGLASGVALIASGNFHTCALLTSGALKCWGKNSNGQLGNGNTTSSNIPVQVNGFTSGATSVIAGIDQSGAQTMGSGLMDWGNNPDGRLGDGTTIQRTSPVYVYGLNSGNVITNTTGFNHSCGLANGEQKCWGDNTYGQLGDGTTTQRLTPTNVISGTVATYTYGDGAHKHAVTSLTSGETYAYDANGNMITRVEGGLTYTQTFDAENRLISVAVSSGQTTQFVYDGDGNLVKKIKPDGSKTIYVGGVYEVDKTAAGSVTRTVTYYPVAGAMRIDSTVYYIAKDLLGSASVVTNSAGVLVGDSRYYPYGETRYTNGSILTDRLFTGQRQMAGLGIYHYGARFYSPKLGRFLSADTIVSSRANPQVLNRYSYVTNNPVRYTDPTGHMVDDGDDGGCSTCKFPKHTYYTSYAKSWIKKSAGYMSTYAIAGIGVQNPYWPPRSTLRGIPGRVLGMYTGIGPAKVTNAEMEYDYGVEIFDSSNSFRGYGLGMKGKNQSNHAIAVEAMMKRIQIRTNACDEKCTSTDIFLVAALAENGPGFNLKNMNDLLYAESLRPRPIGETYSLNWGKFINSADTQEKIDFNKDLIAQFAGNVLYLESKGYDVPDDIDWEYIYSLTTTVQP